MEYYFVFSKCGCLHVIAKNTIKVFPVKLHLNPHLLLTKRQKMETDFMTCCGQPQILCCFIFVSFFMLTCSQGYSVQSHTKSSKILYFVSLKAFKLNPWSGCSSKSVSTALLKDSALVFPSFMRLYEWKCNSATSKPGSEQRFRFNRFSRGL